METTRLPEKHYIFLWKCQKFGLPQLKNCNTATCMAQVGTSIDGLYPSGLPYFMDQPIISLG